jgi:hypothetical protein
VKLKIKGNKKERQKDEIKEKKMANQRKVGETTEGKRETLRPEINSEKKG